MKTQTIWESASRPLFVRSVWLESTREGRGVQHRHFILDYEPQEQIQQQRQQTRSAISPVRKWRRESLRHAISCDLSEISALNESEASADDLLLVGSAKIKLQQQPSHQYSRQQLKLLKFYRRPSFTTHTKKHGSNAYGIELNRRMRELQELYSRHSSLQDMQSTLSNAYSNPEERLAERVLNWLDLANKGGLTKGCENESPIDIMETEAAAAAALQKQQALQRASVAANQSRRKGNISHNRNVTNRAYSNHNLLQQVNHRQRYQRDAVKPITIIFNREGFPVRFNRPARNIDLCALASSAGTTRRLAGTLASVRLYKGNETSPYKTRSLKTPAAGVAVTQPQTSSRTPHTSRSRNGDVDKTAAQSNQKRMLEDYVANNSHIQDSKRQLHIFMPSLPKRGMASPSVLSNCTGEDGTVNVLSHHFNELCKL